MSQAPHTVRGVRWGTALGKDLKVQFEYGTSHIVMYTCMEDELAYVYSLFLFSWEEEELSLGVL